MEWTIVRYVFIYFRSFLRGTNMMCVLINTKQKHFLTHSVHVQYTSKKNSHKRPVPVPFPFSVCSTSVQCPFVARLIPVHFQFRLAPVQTGAPRVGIGVLLRQACICNATRVHWEHLLVTYERTTIQKSFGCRLAVHGHSPFNTRSGTMRVFLSVWRSNR